MKTLLELKVFSFEYLCLGRKIKMIFLIHFQNLLVFKYSQFLALLAKIDS